jgi:hypothetical protein
MFSRTQDGAWCFRDGRMGKAGRTFSRLAERATRDAVGVAAGRRYAAHGRPPHPPDFRAREDRIRSESPRVSSYARRLPLSRASTAGRIARDISDRSPQAMARLTASRFVGKMRPQSTGLRSFPWSRISLGARGCRTAVPSRTRGLDACPPAPRSPSHWGQLLPTRRTFTDSTSASPVARAPGVRSSEATSPPPPSSETAS